MSAWWLRVPLVVAPSGTCVGTESSWSFSERWMWSDCESVVFCSSIWSPLCSDLWPLLYPSFDLGQPVYHACVWHCPPHELTTISPTERNFTICLSFSGHANSLVVTSLGTNNRSANLHFRPRETLHHASIYFKVHVLFEGWYSDVTFRERTKRRKKAIML